MSDNKVIGLTDSDVVKVLEFVARYCKDEYNEIRVDQLLLDAIALIKRQQEEIERLEKEQDQFADRLKESAHCLDISFGYGTPAYCKVVSVGEIDNLVKEMTEDENDG